MQTPRRSPARHGRGIPLSVLTRVLLCLMFIAGAALTASGSHAASSSLRILSTTPTLGATDVPGKALVSITFDRPVVTLNDVGVANAHVPAQLSPRAPGHWEWITTAAWVYQLPQGLALGTRYQVTVSDGFSAQDGSRLPGPYSFTFTTMSPAVSSVAPVAGTQFSLPQDLVQVIFNVPVQRASAQGAFRLRANGVPVAGTFSWNDKQIATQPNGAGATVPPGANGGPNGGPPPPPTPDTVMTFHPAHLLP
ncbi:MAG: Ig-like domain-containing protein, partial [Chloroflexota bacterium]